MTGETDKVLWRGVRPVLGINGIWPARDSVRVYATDAADGIQTTIMYTVPANKLLFISSVYFASQTTLAGNTSCMLFVRNVADAEQYRMIAHLYIAADARSEGFPYSPALEAAAGWDVCVANNKAEAYSRGFMFGWLEDE